MVIKIAERGFKKILITGGAGYVGSELTSSLLNKGYDVKVFDLYIYGDAFRYVRNSNLTEIKGDIRDKNMLIKATKDVDAVIHLACISNDPSFELDAKLGKSINYDSFFNVVEAARINNVKRFIYASTSSVYGVKTEKNVVEETHLEPLTDYSKFKAACESVLQNMKDMNMEWVIIRPATVCGYSKRLRLDLVVNLLTISALINRKIKVIGGSQLRPNINIKDMVRAYELLLTAPGEKINGQIFNAGYQNLTVTEIANLVKEACNDPDVVIEYVPTNDIRSYHINSDKIKKILGFETNFTVEDAIRDLIDAFNSGLIKDGLNNSLYWNIKRMQEISLR